MGNGSISYGCILTTSHGCRYRKAALKWHPDKNIERLGKDFALYRRGLRRNVCWEHRKLQKMKMYMANDKGTHLTSKILRKIICDVSEEATEKFQLVQSAYAVLSDPQERAWFVNHATTPILPRMRRRIFGKGIDYLFSSCRYFSFLCRFCSFVIQSSMHSWAHNLRHCLHRMLFRYDDHRESILRGGAGTGGDGDGIDLMGSVALQSHWGSLKSSLLITRVLLHHLTVEEVVVFHMSFSRRRRT